MKKIKPTSNMNEVMTASRADVIAYIFMSNEIPLLMYVTGIV